MTGLGIISIMVFINYIKYNAWYFADSTIHNKSMMQFVNRIPQQLRAVPISQFILSHACIYMYALLADLVQDVISRIYV
jgi:hypothetical protein